MKLHRLLLPLLPFFAAGAAGPIPFDLLPPGTRILVGCSLASLKNSPLWKDAGVDTGKTPALAAPLSPAGFDLLRNVDSIFFAAAGSAANAPAIAVLRGRFPTLDKHAVNYHGVAVLEDPRNPKYSLAILDGSTAVAGAPDQVRAAIDRRGRPAAAPKVAARFLEMGGMRPPANPLAPQNGQDLLPVSDIWGLGDVPEGLPISGPAAGAGAKDFGIDRFEFAASLREGLRFRASIHARTAQQSSQTLATLGMFTAMLRAQAGPGQTRFDMRVVDGSLEIELFVPEAELRKAITARKDQLAKAMRSMQTDPFSTLRQEGFTAGSPAPFPAAIAPPGLPASMLPPAGPLGPQVRPVPNPPGTVLRNGRGDAVVVTLPGGR